MALTEKLTNIGNAIRAKTGKTNLLTLDEMPTEIQGISGGGEEYFTDEDLTFNDYCDYLFYRNRLRPVLQKEIARIKIQNPTSMANMFRENLLEDWSNLPAIIGDGTTSVATRSIFQDSQIKKLPLFRNIHLNNNQSGSQFNGCTQLNDVNEVLKFWNGINNAGGVNGMQTNFFYSNCYSLRNVNATFPVIKRIFQGNYYFNYGNMFESASSLDEVKDLLCDGFERANTSDHFISCVSGAARLKEFTFETNNGVPFVVSWKNQILDFSSYTGWSSSSNVTHITQFNSGITADKEVKDDNTYAALKNDPDWYTKNMAYSRYNHDSAVNTINSLPDTSAYLTTAGGTNTIKFAGAAGEKTDGGAINTLTEEEIAVATAKGWTVTLV